MKKQILTMGLAVVASVASAASPAFTTAAERVDSLMRCLFHDGEPGVAVVVAKNDDVIVDSGYGVADIVTGDRIDGNTMFNIASISKQFTVAGVLSLADRVLLRVDNAVADFLPYESGQWRKIRLSHLMSHSSGVIDARPRTDRQWMLHATDKESVAYMDTLRQFRFEPGEAYEYINPTFQVLECVIEKVSGLTFDDYQQRYVFDRAGLRHTTYFEPQKRMPIRLGLAAVSRISPARRCIWDALSLRGRRGRSATMARRRFSPPKPMAGYIRQLMRCCSGCGRWSGAR